MENVGICGGKSGDAYIHHGECQVRRKSKKFCDRFRREFGTMGKVSNIAS